MAAVPELGRAAGVEAHAAPEAATTHQLYELYARQIYGFCLNRLGNREEAEDAVQTTFMNAFRGLRRGISPEAESAWLFKIAHNVCLTRRRSASRRGRIETPGDLQALQDFVAAPQRMGADELIELQEALAAMPSSQRKAILLREWRGLSYREIADELELTQAAVEALIFRARRSLARGLEAPPEEHGRVWRRLRQGMDVGSLLAVLKTFLSGGAAAKAVAAAAAVTATAVVTAVAGEERAPRSEVGSAAPAARVAEPAAAPTAPVALAAAAVAEPRLVRPVVRAAGRPKPAPVPPARKAAAVPEIVADSPPPPVVEHVVTALPQPEPAGPASEREDARPVPPRTTSLFVPPVGSGRGAPQDKPEKGKPEKAEKPDHAPKAEPLRAEPAAETPGHGNGIPGGPPADPGKSGEQNKDKGLRA